MNSPRKQTSWNKHVMSVYHNGQKKNKDFTLKDAMKSASKTYHKSPRKSKKRSSRKSKKPTSKSSKHSPRKSSRMYGFFDKYKNMKEEHRCKGIWDNNDKICKPTNGR